MRVAGLADTAVGMHAGALLQHVRGLVGGHGERGRSRERDVLSGRECARPERRRAFGRGGLEVGARARDVVASERLLDAVEKRQRQRRSGDPSNGRIVDGLHLTATPSRHYSGRLPRYKNETLWASWVVTGPAHRFYFSGDTGWFDGFARIGHGPFDLTLIKIGAYDPSWAGIHMNPEEAVRTHVELRGR